MTDDTRIEDLMAEIADLRLEIGTQKETIRQLEATTPSEEIVATLRRVLSTHVGADVVSLQNARMRERLSDPCGCSVDYAKERLRQTEEALAWLDAVRAAKGGA